MSQFPHDHKTPRSPSPPAAPAVRPVWFRRNRWGLSLLPVAALLATAVASDRMVMFWYPSGPHDVTTGSVGKAVDFTQDWQDRSGKYVRHVQVTVKGITPTSVVQDYNGKDVTASTPTGTKVWRVSMDFSADPDEVIQGCLLEVVDTVGRSYPYATTFIKPTNAKAAPCLNPGEKGPEPVLVPGQSQVNDEPRPPTWSPVADVVLAAEAEPALVRIWWEYPKVIEVPVTPTQ